METSSGGPDGSGLTEGLGGMLPTATVVEILPTRIWVESDMMGSRHVVCQHQGMAPFTYASFHYNYAYTSNGGTFEAAKALAVSLGAAEPVEQRQRDFHLPTADELRAEIALLQAELDRIAPPNDEAHRRDAAGGPSGGADCSAAAGQEKGD